MKKNTRLLIEHRHKIALLLFVAYVFFIIYYTLLCREVGNGHKADLRLMWAYREMFTGHPEWKEDIGYNVKNILFLIPFGICFPKINLHISFFRDKRWLLILSVGMLLSVFVEITQYTTCRGLCELDDVLCNGLGSFIGYWISIVLRKVWTATRDSSNLGVR
ncbi:VanZ family protein [Ruminococcus flavefaciens]|uniref:VanZ family protein n=1 Tax=Ruminococcus flavefaciens TaxID=1265 RepID=UPI00035C875F|nr:VanZ family protein [Ruminococcus flavefaciens]